MSIGRPFHRNYRGIKKGENWGYSDWAYIADKEYAKDPTHYVRAYNLIQQDLQKIFEYIEPADESWSTYSFRVHELLMRTCIEVEANCKAILSENIYTPDKNEHGKPVYNIELFKIIDRTHHLSAYEISLPIWTGKRETFKPFNAWKGGWPLGWYQAYNESKHDRHEAFKKASFGQLMMAVTGLLVLLSAQFKTEDFSAGSRLLALEDDYHNGEAALGGLFRIKFPDDWTEEEQYDFNWSVLQSQPDRFQKINYDLLK